MTLTIHLTLFYVVWFVLMFFFILSMVTFFTNRTEFHKQRKKNPEFKPRVSIVIPAYNEEKSIADTIESTLSINYPKDKLDVIVVNDGSKDGTGEICKKYASEGKIIYLENNPNQGKSESLNRGIRHALTDYVACIDADTIVEKDIIEKTMPYFDSPEIAAVTTSINVKESRNLLQKIITVEYSIANSFYNKIWSCLNCMFVTPGQFSIYLKDKVLELGGFDRNNLVEDMELAYRMNKNGMKIAVCTNATAYTIVPHTLKDFYYQRKRWYTGTIQTILKHRDVIMNPRLGSFGMYFVPFNYGGTVLTIFLSLSFLAIILSNADLAVSNLHLINFDVLAHARTVITHFQWDVFYISKYHVLGLTPLVMNAIVSYTALNSVGYRVKDNIPGFIGFMFFFIPYQIMWLLSMYFVAFKKEVKWRAGM